MLERLPSVTATESIATNVDKALLARLETSQYGNKQSQTGVRPKGKKFPAGTCIRPDEIASSDEETEEDPVEQPRGGSGGGAARRGARGGSPGSPADP